jgi:hypothetical protein
MIPYVGGYHVLGVRPMSLRDICKMESGQSFEGEPGISLYTKIERSIEVCCRNKNEIQLKEAIAQHKESKAPLKDRSPKESILTSGSRIFFIRWIHATIMPNFLVSHLHLKPNRRVPLRHPNLKTNMLA